MGIIAELLRNLDEQQTSNDPTPYKIREPQTELYNQQRQAAMEDERASSDELDKNLITLSSGALGLSIAFIKDIVHLPDAVLLWLLIASWICLTLAILATLISFVCSGQALKRHSEYLYKYYIERDDSFFNKRSSWSSWVTGCAWVGATSFIIGVIMTVVFISVNVRKGHTAMSDDLKNKTAMRVGVTDARPTPQMTPICEARAPQAMIPAETRGRMPQSMAAIPRPSTPSSSSQSTQTTANGGSKK